MSGELFGIWWLWWLVGTLGLGGTIAAFVMAPAVAMPVFQAALRFLLGTRIGVGLLVGLVVFVAADIHRSRLDQRVWDAKVASFEQRQKERDQKIADDTRAAVTAEIAAQNVANAATDQKTEDFTHDLPPIPATGNPFAVGPDACRLRNIAGLPCSEPGGEPAPMPKADPRHRSPKHYWRKRL